MPERKAVTILSGGMDSTVLLYHLIDEGYRVTAISFNYGQRHKKELRYAEETTRKICAEHHIVHMPDVGAIISHSSLTNPHIKVPEGHYTDESMRITIVPNRNAIMLSVAYGHAVSIDAELVAYGAHAGDHAIYPDCRAEFIDALEFALQTGNNCITELYAPFINNTKADIVKLGQNLGVPWKDTWSCYKGLKQHCGVCGTCVERREAFKIAGVTDSTIYMETFNVSPI